MNLHYFIFSACKLASYNYKFIDMSYGIVFSSEPAQKNSECKLFYFIFKIVLLPFKIAHSLDGAGLTHARYFLT